MTCYVSGCRVGLLAGRVGVGKTTVAERVVSLARQRGLRCGGLLAPAMLNSCGEKVGIWGVDLISAERRVLARTDRCLHGPTVGPYSFDATALAWAVRAIQDAMQICTYPALGTVSGKALTCQLLIVDEIGKLELWQDAGLSPVLPRLAACEVARALVLVRDSLLSELEDRLGQVERLIFRVSDENRESIHAEILERLLANSESAG